MIIMINGAFGVSKTIVARLLNERLTDSLLYDPEEVGFMLRNILVPTVEPAGDFQDIALWPGLVVEVARRLRETYHKTLIVPMTLAFPTYFRQIRTGLAEFEDYLFHFCLTASTRTIQQRLATRGERPGDWSYQQIECCQTVFTKSEYAEWVDTQQRSPDQVADYILTRISQPGLW